MARRNIWRSNTTHHKPKLLEIASRRAFRSSEKTDPCCVRSSEKTNRCFGKSSEKTGPCCIRSSEKTDRCFSISSEKILVDTKYPTNVEVTNSSGPPTSAKDNSSNFFLKLSQVFCTRSASLSLSAGSCSARTCAANCKDKRVEIHMANNFFLDLLDLLHFQTDGSAPSSVFANCSKFSRLTKPRYPSGVKPPGRRATEPPSSTGRQRRSKARSKRSRETRKGTRCFLCGSLLHRLISNIFISPTAAGMSRTNWGPFWNKLPTCPRSSHWPVPYKI